MPEPEEILREARHVVVQDFPSRDIPDALTRAGLTVTIYGGPAEADVVLSALSDGAIMHRQVGRYPDEADLYYTYRPLAEIDSVVSEARRLGVSTLWRQPGARPRGRPGRRSVAGAHRGGRADLSGLAPDRSGGSGDHEVAGDRQTAEHCVSVAHSTSTQPPLARRALRVGQSVVLEDSGFHGGFELPVCLDRRSILGQLLVDGHSTSLGETTASVSGTKTRLVLIKPTFTVTNAGSSVDVSKYTASMVPIFDPSRSRTGRPTQW